MASVEQKPIPVRVDSKGRVNLPASLREELRLEVGDTLFVQRVGRTLRFSKPEDPFEILGQHAEREYAAGHTTSLDDYAKKQGASQENDNG